MNIPLMRISLKECPWCHDMPVLAKDPLWSGSHGYHGNYEYYVACNNGNCKIKPCTKSYDNIYDMSEQECINKAIDDWNTR